jgi:hypothetical protein
MRFWLQIDLDVRFCEVLPAVDYQQSRGGLTSVQLTERCNTAVARDSFVALDVTIYNSDLHPGRGGLLCRSVLSLCLLRRKSPRDWSQPRETFTVGAATSLREHHDCYSQLRRGVFRDALLLFRE